MLVVGGIVAAICFAVFVVPAAVIGHLVGFTPSLGQIFGKNHGDVWMDAHYPSVVGRFVLVDLALLVVLIGGLVLLGRSRAARAPWMVDPNRSHAYCASCHRRLYAGQRTCLCGQTLSEDWEQRYVEKQGIPPEARSGAGQPLESTPTRISSPRGASDAVGTQVQEASRDASLAGQLRELADLHSRGALSDSELEQAKARLIAG